MMKLSSIFCDGMILQGNKPIRIFGEGDGYVCVKFMSYSATVASSDGKWLVELPPLPYGGPYTMEITLDGETQVINDILIGDVLLLGGQSNMQFKLWESNYPKEQYEAFADMRLFSPARLEDNEHFKPQDGWVKCTPESAAHWSAIGYLVGQQIHKEKGVAVGLVSCYQGASEIQSWLPKDVLANNPKYNIPLEKRHWDHNSFPVWNKDAVLYEFAFKSLAPFSFSNVLWYQGESNATEAESAVYSDMLTDMIKSWRADLKDPALPFTVIQIADSDERMCKGWINIQKAQSIVAQTNDNVTLIQSKDVCETDDIHPKSKTILSKRIADSILAK